MKKVNFKKRVSQLMAGLFGLALMGGVMLSSQEVDAQKLEIGEVSIGGNNTIPCASSISEGQGDQRVVDCSTCSMVNGVSNNDLLIGTCKPSKK